MTKKTSDISYYVGLILLAIGAFGLTFAAYLAMIGLPIFIFGLILVLVSLKRTWKNRLFPIGLFILGIIAFWPIWRQINSVGPEVFLIPDDYRGRVNILYKEGCGQVITKTEEGIVYTIPDNGILILDAEQEFGIIEHTYYLIDKKGNRTELAKMDVRDFNEEWSAVKNPNEPSRDKLGVFFWGSTGSQGQSTDHDGNVTNENEQYTFCEFYVSSYNDLTGKFGFKYTVEFDKMRDKEFEKCK